VIPADRRFVQREIDRAIAAYKKQVDKDFARFTPRRASFALELIATGTGTTHAVSWSVPIGSDYAVFVSVTCAAAAVGLLTAGVAVGTKTPTGCTIVVANRTGAQLNAATFDVLAFPL
jgi:hypothetical protein